LEEKIKGELNKVTACRPEGNRQKTGTGGDGDAGPLPSEKGEIWGREKGGANKTSKGKTALRKRKGSHFIRHRSVWFLSGEIFATKGSC